LSEREGIEDPSWKFPTRSQRRNVEVESKLINQQSFLKSRALPVKPQEKRRNSE